VLNSFQHFLSEDKFQWFQLHRMIFRISQDSPVYGRLSMVPVVASFFFFLIYFTLLCSRFHFDRLGLVPRSSPRQADLIFTASTVTMKMAPSFFSKKVLKNAWRFPSYGSYNIAGGMFIQYRFLFFFYPSGSRSVLWKSICRAAYLNQRQLYML